MNIEFENNVEINKYKVIHEESKRGKQAAEK